MKLIIDIPELFYNNSKKRVSSGIDLPIDKYVANGKPYEERPQGELVGDTDFDNTCKCSECSWYEVCCPNCGADMRGKEE